ncbi:hypothetical protein [Spirosoma oryzicola]|uniref:hypothetical protein n=1 Tax=Spirosoma oryzicola TaxID=2898794 RepID=UPI001E53F12B|nr:hypothetical protein [Spirosoma oryzicola]UHG93452.1 hypothetical protein LQ777_11220 [Spirosoma oryzicola]
MRLKKSCNMAALFKIRSELFATRLNLTDYEIYRDGFCLWIKNDKKRLGYQLLIKDLTAMITALMGFAIVPNSVIEAVLVEDSSVWKIPSDEQIIQYCIDQAFIPHPYEEYISAP